VNICLKKTSIMGWIERDSISFKIVHSRSVRNILVIVKNGGSFWWITSANTETGKFVGIHPNCRESNFLIKDIKHILPIASCVWMEEINIDCISHSHSANHRQFSIGVQYINVSLQFLLIKIPFIFNAWVNNWDPFIVF
jgi:hypothetical protein